MDRNSNIAQTLYSPEDLRNRIRQLLNQQNIWTRFLIISKLSGLGDIQVVSNRLFENAIDIGNLFRSYYGDDIGNEIENMLRNYFTLIINLIDVYINTNFNIPGNVDFTLINEINSQLYGVAKQISVFLSSINSYWNMNTLENIFKNNVDFINNEIYKRKIRQYYADVTLYDYIEYYYLMTADILWNGFINQFYKN